MIHNILTFSRCTFSSPLQIEWRWFPSRDYCALSPCSAQTSHAPSTTRREIFGVGEWMERNEVEFSIVERREWKKKVALMHGLCVNTKIKMLSHTNRKVIILRIKGVRGSWRGVIPVVGAPFYCAFALQPLRLLCCMTLMRRVLQVMISIGVRKGQWKACSCCTVTSRRMIWSSGDVNVMIVTISVWLYLAVIWNYTEPLSLYDVVKSRSWSISCLDQLQLQLRKDRSIGGRVETTE